MQLAQEFLEEEMERFLEEGRHLPLRDQDIEIMRLVQELKRMMESVEKVTLMEREAVEAIAMGVQRCGVRWLSQLAMDTEDATAIPPIHLLPGWGWITHLMEVLQAEELPGRWLLRPRRMGGWRTGSKLHVGTVVSYGGRMGITRRLVGEGLNMARVEWLQPAPCSDAGCALCRYGKSRRVADTEGYKAEHYVSRGPEHT